MRLQLIDTPKLSTVILSLVLLVGCTIPALSADAPSVDFARDVRPILARHCFKCHGPDDNKRAAGLRLDNSAGATGETKAGNHAIVAGNLEESELVARIQSDDPTEVMPPPDAKDPLSTDQKRILTAWVAAGGKYTDHWAFVRPERPEVPNLDGLPTHWKTNPIDSFIYQKLKSHALSPQPETDRRSLIRRVSLDLTGIPPTPAETAAFLADKSPDAYEKLVGRLLDSPRYGERWARKWLDLARYADTNGYEKDRARSIWPYRDWVINALNNDMPFDQFTIRQLAGDMLPQATQDDYIATGFHRNTMLNEEGGIDPLEYRFYAMVDRVGTTGSVWLGMSIACAQCHNHKYDPIAQTDYYRVMASLNNAEEPPLYELNSPEIERQNAEINRKINALVSSLREQFPAEPAQGPADKQPEPDRRTAARQKAFDAWLVEQSSQAVDWTLLEPSGMKANLARLEKRPDGSIFAFGDATKHDEYELQFDSLPAGTTAVRLEVLPDPALPAHGPGRTDYEGPLGDFFLSEFQLNGIDGTIVQPIKIASASESFGKLGIGGGGAGAALALDSNMQTGWSTNGHQGKDDQAVFVLEKPLDKPTHARLTMIFERHYSAPLGRFRLWTTTSNFSVTAKSVPTHVEQLLAASKKSNVADQSELERYWLRYAATELADVRKQIDALEASRPKPTTTLVMKERPSSFKRQTFVHKRGEFLQPTTEVQAGGPAFLMTGLEEHQPKNRLELARWLISKENPLTARVVVNRQWAAFFGRGLVRTQEDFGYQGELPSHPELLDWLARSFVDDDKWSLKKLHRQIVTSATYRQSSNVSPDSIAKDPDNKFLSHGPRFRMDGEVVRDAALAVSGLLTQKVGGPSVFPPQPESVTTEGAYGKLAWTVSTGADRYRRSLYTFAKRTAPFAMLNTFDAPSGESCVVRRDVSNSALQSLTLLNDPIFMEAALALGRQFGGDSKSEHERLNLLFERVLNRTPDDAETRLMLGFLKSQRDHFTTQPQLAKSLTGDEKDAEKSREIATWTTLARAIMNTDEFVVHR